MSFDDFEKDDLDFDSLISAPKPQKKFPKSSEGLRFLTRDLRKDAAKKSLIENSSIDENRAASPSPVSDEDNHITSIDNKSSFDFLNPNLLNSTIDKTSPTNANTTKLETSIDEISAKSPNQNHLDSSIDKNSTAFLQETVLNSSIDEFLTDRFTTNRKSASLLVEVSELFSNEETRSTNTEQYPSSDHSTEAKIERIKTPQTFSPPAPLEMQKIEISVDHVSSVDNLSTRKEGQQEHKSSIDNFRADDAIERTNNGDLVSTIDKIRTVDITTLNPKIHISETRAHTVKFKGNYTKLSNHIFKIWKDFSKTEKLLLLYFYRASFGWNKTITNIPLSIRFLEGALPLSHNSIPSGIKSLKDRGILTEVESSSIGTKYEIHLFSEQSKITAPISDYYTPLDNNFFELSKKCSSSDMIVYLMLYRQSYGFNQNVTTQKILTSKLALEVGLSVRRTQDAIRNLLSISAILRVSDISSSGIIYRVLLPQEILDCETKTETEFTLQANLNTSIDKTSNLESSIADKSFSNSNSSIDKTRSHFSKSQQIAVKSEHADAGLKPSIDKNRDKETPNTNKTSSGDVDDVLDFFETRTSKTAKLEFRISRQKISELLKIHSADFLKTAFSKLIPVMSRETVTNPVGIFLHAIKNPESFVALQKPSAEESVQIKHNDILVEQREKSFAHEFKTIIEEKLQSHWAKLGEDDRINLINKRREEMVQGERGMKIPESAIKRSAMEKLFWGDCEQIWNSLHADDRQERATKVKKTIIERVYAGEGGASLNTLPRREFLKSVDGFAEKLAMISVTKIEKN